MEALLSQWQKRWGDIFIYKVESAENLVISWFWQVG